MIGVHGDCLWGLVRTCVTHFHPYLPPGPMGSSGGGSHVTGTGVGSNFRFVVHLELKPAKKRYRRRDLSGDRYRVTGSNVKLEMCRSPIYPIIWGFIPPRALRVIRSDPRRSLGSSREPSRAAARPRVRKCRRARPRAARAGRRDRARRGTRGRGPIRPVRRATAPGVRPVSRAVR